MTSKQQFGCSVRDRIASFPDRIRNRNKTASRHGHRWRSRLEHLEARRLLAGDVQVLMQDGSLLISGDDLDNGVAIIAGSVPNQLVITGVYNNGETTINGQWQEVVSGVRGNILINLRDGNDNFYFNASPGRNVILPGQLRILGRGGDDQIHLTTSDALFEVYGKTQIDSGTGEDTITLRSGGVDGAMTMSNLSILTDDGDDEVLIETRGGNARIDVPGKLAIYPGTDSDDVLISARDADSAISVGDLRISDPQGEDSIRIQAFSDNASLTVKQNTSISTGDSEDAVLLEAEFGSATLIADGSVRINSGNAADLVSLYANHDDTRVIARDYVKIDTGDAGLFAGGDYAMILANSDNASMTFEKNVLIRTGNSLDGEQFVQVRAGSGNAALDFQADLTVRVDDSPQFGASVNISAGSGSAHIHVAEDLRILTGTGAVDLTIEAQNDQASIRVGNDLRIFGGGGSSDVQLATGSLDAQLIIEDDLTVLLGDGDDSLSISGITVLDDADLDGEEGLDTFIDDGGNLIGSLTVVSFEL